MSDKFRDIYCGKGGGGDGQLGKKIKNYKLGEKMKKGKEKSRKITLKKRGKAFKMHHFGL